MLQKCHFSSDKIVKIFDKSRVSEFCAKQDRPVESNEMVMAVEYILLSIC
jgi:hypothetical protein